MIKVGMVEKKPKNLKMPATYVFFWVENKGFYEDYIHIIVLLLVNSFIFSKSWSQHFSWQVFSKLLARGFAFSKMQKKEPLI